MDAQSKGPLLVKGGFGACFYPTDRQIGIYPLDTLRQTCYNTPNFIGQFVTILSVNKTREFGWVLCAHFCFVGADCARFFF